MTSNQIKLTAAATMLIDHIGVILRNAEILDPASPVYLAMRMIGRLAFPLFCFLLSEGSCKTSNREKYFGRLCWFALLAQIPYSIMSNVGEGNTFTMDWIGALLGVLCCAAIAYGLHASSSRTIAGAAWAWVFAQIHCSVGAVEMLSEELNVIYTLAIALLLIMSTDKLYQDISTKANKAECILLCLGVGGVVCSLLTNIMYGPVGLLLPLALYWAREWKYGRAAVLGVWAAVQYWDSPLYMLAALVTVVIVLVYNGQKGSGRLPKNFFYWFYPGHMAVLGIVRMLLSR